MKVDGRVSKLRITDPEKDLLKKKLRIATKSLQGCYAALHHIEKKARTYTEAVALILEEISRGH